VENNLSCLRLLYACTLAVIASPAEIFTTLLSFNGTDGANSIAALVQATNGKFYGTTEKGGVGGGTVFDITAEGKLITLYTFCSETDCFDGDEPYAGLVQATNGKFYGTTLAGGTNNSGADGTVFEITPAGKRTTLYNFCSVGPPLACYDGANPAAGLVQAANGNFYGTTENGGANEEGTGFEITAKGELTTLHSFDLTDGANPVAGLVQATNGNFYGTTQFGGANGYGTVFEITPAGKLTTLHSFCRQMNDEESCTDGANPVAGLVQATNGNFYGTTGVGGANNNGTIFEMTAGGTLTTLHSFDNFNDGDEPSAALIQATNGNFYGTTKLGRTICAFDGCGTVFSLAVGLGPFVETLPTSGNVGTAVIILGNNLTSATGVSFNGTGAAFTVVSSSEITTTVPSGATTGKVDVTTPSGTLTSNVKFQVH
jgi:uncharacterized repeat protein (TIGR03803 family)